MRGPARSSRSDLCTPVCSDRIGRQPALSGQGGAGIGGPCPTPAVRDYDEPPTALPEVVAHVLELPSQEAALTCQDTLPSGQIQDAVIRYEDGDGWLLFAFYSELPPDPEFNEREQALRQTVERVGGRYSGSQGGPA